MAVERSRLRDGTVQRGVPSRGDARRARADARPAGDRVMIAVEQGGARTYAVTAAGRDAGELEHDMGAPFHRRWRWVSASGAVEEFFETKTEAKDHLAWLNRCRAVDVLLVERRQEGEAA